ncbi:hypothetical protein FQA39_LY18679 [Lamprigera yunnana]|nr:hypothetical protein FQA39_LY18679 [Lamprigera yunnana]
MLSLVPASLREAAYALGTPKWKVISMVTLRAARAGVITGVLLAVARIAGETAPLLFTALNNQFWNSDLSKPMASLPVTIFKFAMSPYENWQQLAWAGVFLITMAVLGLNILARLLGRQKLTNASAQNAKISVRDLNFYYGKFHALKNINLEIPEKKGKRLLIAHRLRKSTLLRTFNRMYELYAEQRAEGQIVLDGENLLTSKQDVALIRAKVGNGFPKAHAVPDVDLRQHRLWCEVVRRPEQDRHGRARGVGAAQGRAVERGQGQAGPKRLGLVGWPAATPVHCARRGDSPRSAVAGRTLLGAGPHLDRQDRGIDRRAEKRLHRGDRDPQHATGGALQRLHRLHVPGQPDGVWCDGADVLQAAAQRNRRLHHGPFWLIFDGRDSA